VKLSRFDAGTRVARSLRWRAALGLVAVVVGAAVPGYASADAAVPAVGLEQAGAATAEPETAVLDGRVLEALSGRPLAGARVRVAEREAVTDAEGRFRLELAPGPARLEATAEDHMPVERTLVLEPGPRRVELYMLDPRVVSETVEVSARAEGGAEEPARLPVTPREVLRVAGGADNVFRVLQTLPGVAATEEFGSRLSVRGGSPDQNLTVMDGIEIHNPYRLFGLTSAFNPETVASFELTAGAFDARYGDRLSSLLLVENRDGDASRRLGGSTALSITDANVVLEGGLPGRAPGSFLVTGRRTYYDLVAERFVNDDLPSFADLQGRFVLEPRAGQRVTLIGLRSREATDASFTGDPGESGDFVGDVKNDVVSLGFASNLGSRGSSRSVVAWYRNTELLDVAARFQSETRRSNVPDSDYAFVNVAFDREVVVEDLSARQELAFQAGPRHLIETGFELHRLQTGVRQVIVGDRNPTAANGSSVQGGAGLPDFIDSSRDATRAGAWLQDRLQMMGRRLEIVPGLRLDWSGVNGRVTLSPRFGAALGLGAATRLRLGVGRHTQSPGYEKLLQSDYFLDLTDVSRLDLVAEDSLHFVLGLERQLGAGVSARLEGYYKTFDDLIAGRLETDAERASRLARYDFPPELRGEIPTAAIITSFPTNDGKGSAYGFDVYLAKQATGADTRLTGWASYTYGVAWRDNYGRRYPFEYDRRHAFSLAGSWRLSRRWELAATARVASGFPRTPALGVVVSAVADPLDPQRLVPERDAAGNLIYTIDNGDVSNLNTARLPLFARLDLRGTFRPGGPSGRWELYLDVINVLNRDNAGQIQAELEPDPASDRPRIVERRNQRIPLLPSFGVRFRF
jgi:hypothetical protein